MPLIKMMKTAPGADEDSNGISMGVKDYLEGQSYEVCEALAVAFCEHMSVAERVIAEQELEEKDLGQAPENKMEKPKRKRKSEA